MREQLSGWSGYLARIDLTIELERAHGSVIPDGELDAMNTPLDVMHFYSGRTSADVDIESAVVAWLARVRGTPSSLADLRLDYATLFAVTEHP